MHRQRGAEVLQVMVLILAGLPHSFVRLGHSTEGVRLKLNQAEYRFPGNTWLMPQLQSWFHYL